VSPPVGVVTLLCSLSVRDRQRHHVALDLGVGLRLCDLRLCARGEMLAVGGLGVALDLRSVVWPLTDMISCAVQSLSAMTRQPPLRRPCGLQVFGNPAAATCLRNQLLKLFLPNGRPHSLVRKVSESGGLGQASMAATSDAGNGTSTLTG
jgi:hypothetical protein